MANVLHKAQAKILGKLLFSEESSFAELCKATRLSSDHFTFHLTALVRKKYIHKTVNGYRITNGGKRVADLILNTDNHTLLEPKIVVVVVATKPIDEEDHIIICRRTKHPFFNQNDLIAGKIEYGEGLEDGAKRILKRETGYSAKLKMITVEHKREYTNDAISKVLLDDIYLFVFHATSLTGHFVKKHKGGENSFVKVTDVHTLPNLFPNIAQFIKALNLSHLSYAENEYKGVVY